MNQIEEKCNAIFSLHRTFLEILKRVEEKLEKVEERQLLILEKIAKPKKTRRTTHIPQNIGCVRTGKNFKEVKLHKNRVTQIEVSHKEVLSKNIQRHFGCYLLAFLNEPQNRSFYRPCRQHSYVYSATRGWEEERASYLLQRLEIISTKYFRKYVKKLRPALKLDKFTIKKALLIRKLNLCKDRLRESKCLKAQGPDSACYK